MMPVSISVRLCVRLLLRPCLPPLSLSLSVCVRARFALSQPVSVRACLLTLSQERALTCHSERWSSSRSWSTFSIARAPPSSHIFRVVCVCV